MKSKVQAAVLCRLLLISVMLLLSVGAVAYGCRIVRLYFFDVVVEFDLEDDIGDREGAFVVVRLTTFRDRRDIIAS